MWRGRRSNFEVDSCDIDVLVLKWAAKIVLADIALAPHIKSAAATSDVNHNAHHLSIIITIVKRHLRRNALASDRLTAYIAYCDAKALIRRS